MIQHVLAGYVGQFCMAYLDDIIIYSSGMNQHEEHLRQVFECFRVHGLHCSLKKCQFAQHHVEYLGHILTQDENLAHLNTSNS